MKKLLIATLTLGLTGCNTVIPLQNTTIASTRSYGFEGKALVHGKAIYASYDDGRYVGNVYLPHITLEQAIQRYLNENPCVVAIAEPKITHESQVTILSGKEVLDTSVANCHP